MICDCPNEGTIGAHPNSLTCIGSDRGSPGCREAAFTFSFSAGFVAVAARIYGKDISATHCTVGRRSGGGDRASTESDTAFSFSGGFLAAATTFVVTHEARRLLFMVSV